MKISICNEKLTKQFTELGTTEAKMGEQIIFNKIFLLDYIFEKEQLLNIKIFSPEDSNIQFEIDCTVARIMGSRNLCYIHKIVEESDEGQKLDLIIDAKNAKESKELVKLKVELELYQHKAEMLGGFDLYEVFFTLNNFIDGKNYRSIYKSEEVKGVNNRNDINNNLSFNEIQIPKDLLCEKDEDHILFRFYDTKFFEFADTKVTYKDLRDMCGVVGNYPGSGNYWDVYEKESKQAIGRVKFNYKAQKIKTFVDYLSENLQINLIIAIDFTASNGD